MIGPDTPTAPCMIPVTSPTPGEARRPSSGDTETSPNHSDLTTNSRTAVASTISRGRSGVETSTNVPSTAPSADIADRTGTSRVSWRACRVRQLTSTLAAALGRVTIATAVSRPVNGVRIGMAMSG